MVVTESKYGVHHREGTIGRQRWRSALFCHRGERQSTNPRHATAPVHSRFSERHHDRTRLRPPTPAERPGSDKPAAFLAELLYTPACPLRGDGFQPGL